MSEETLKEFERIRREMLLAQRICAWCEKKCNDSDHLFLHTVLRHPEIEGGRQVEPAILEGEVEFSDQPIIKE